MNQKPIAIFSKKCWIDHKLQPATLFIKDGLIERIELEKSKPKDGIFGRPWR